MAFIEIEEKIRDKLFEKNNINQMDNPATDKISKQNIKSISNITQIDSTNVDS